MPSEPARVAGVESALPEGAPGALVGLPGGVRGRFASDQRLFDRDLPRLIRDWIVPGYAPSAPMLEADAGIVTVGSCFAREVRRALVDLGCSSAGFWPPRLTHAYAIHDFLTWCITGEHAGLGYRYDRVEGGEIGEWMPGAPHDGHLQTIRDAGAFVLGFAVADIWEDRETNHVFWRGVPRDVYVPGRHGPRATGVEENETAVLRLVELIRSENGAAPIVLMLSPTLIPASFRGVSCIAADCIAKSTMRIAFERVASSTPGVHYWPTFEIVRWVGPHLPWRAFGDEGQPRNPCRYLLRESAGAFVESFYTPAAVAELRARARPPAVPSPGSLRGRIEYPVRVALRRRRRKFAHRHRPHLDRRWHTRGALRFPSKQKMLDEDLPRLIGEWIAPGYAPPSGMLAAGDEIVTLGSDFAQVFGDELRRLGFAVRSGAIPPRQDDLDGAVAVLVALESAEETVEESEESIVRVVESIRSANRDAPVVLMLSPVPLAATAGSRASIPADCFSKSVARIALDRVLGRRVPGVHYWPAFEAVRWVGAHAPYRAYGAEGADPRSVSPRVVRDIAKSFAEAFWA